MSARKVCRGTRPSRYHSVRAISEPLSRPDMRTLMPSAPLRIVLMTARFMARRNITRFSICCEMLSATSCASSSGLRISEMFRRTSGTAMPSRLAVSARSFSMSSPFLPITMPGRAVWIVMLTFLAARSINTRLTEASVSFLRRNWRTRKSVCTSCGNCFLLAYPFDVQSRVIPSRMPSGLTFWPMLILPAVADLNRDVAVALDDAAAAPLGARGKAFEHRRHVDLDAIDLELIDVRAQIVLGLRNRRFEHLEHKLRALLRHELQGRERIADTLAAHR